jgi:Gas vesicle synthesis protein GvpL/GvpF
MSSAAGAAAALPDNDLGWYLYGVVAGDGALPELHASGLAVDRSHEVELVVEGPLAGVASRVSLKEFDEATLSERLADAAWLEQKIRAHEQVLERVLHETSIVPCRFCAVYRSETEMRRFLSERRNALQAALDRVQGQVEVGVKAFLDRDRFVAGEAIRNNALRDLEERAAAATSGRAYLERRRLDQLVASEVERFRSSAGAEIHSRLLACAGDGLPLALQATEVSGRDKEMIFYGAYLVGVDRSAFEATLGRLAADYREAGVEFELTGPWPPYNFVPAELRAA